MTTEEKMELLPIGSVVKLKGVAKHVMIYGRNQMKTSSKKVYDYISVPYPEGNITENFNLFFNRSMIEEVLFEGFQTPEETELKKRVEYEIKNNKTVEAQKS